MSKDNKEVLNRADILQRIQGLRPMDDDFMTKGLEKQRGKR